MGAHDSAVAVLAKLFVRIRDETWSDERGKQAVLTGIRLCIDTLKQTTLDAQITRQSGESDRLTQ